jgi:NAD(P)H-flavin reductase
LSATVTDSMVSRQLPVRRRVRETHDTYSLEIDAPDENGGFRFVPGQFNMLYAYGVGEIPISISGDPAVCGRLTHTIRAVGTVSKALAELKPGMQIGVRGPYGEGWPVERLAGKDVLIVAGGIGLAPLRPAIHYLLARRQDYGKIIILYGARGPEEILYRKDLERWRSHLDLEVLVTVDKASARWKGNVGVVTTLINRVQFDPLHCAALVCGPEIMMRFVFMGLIERQLDERSIFISMERNMKCGIGLCGHCQLGPVFVCKDGPVFCYERIKKVFQRREM